MVAAPPDRFGIGWRPGLAASTLRHLDRIDVLEVLAGDRRLSRAEVAGLRAVGREVPLLVHATSLGLASEHSMDEDRLDLVARAVAALEPEAWSEHLAFVRAGGVEIGHLAAPPRFRAVVEGAARNVARAREVVGSAPDLENVASLFDPPSEMSEPAFVAAVVEGAGTGLLLDLHNLHANAVNFGFDPVAWLDAVPLERVRIVHVAGGRPVRDAKGAEKILDDHLHDVPAPVEGLLAEVASRVRGPLTVVLERDGRFPAIDVLLRELDRARGAVARGRSEAR